MIRISSNTIFENGLSGMLERQSAVARLQDQIGTGRRVQTPSDDPVAAARSLEVEQASSINDQYQRNGASATASLTLSENSLASVTSLIQDIRTLGVNAGNGALSDTELKTLAGELQSRYQELLGVANATDGNGQYLFSGYQGSTQPFAEIAPGSVVYNGDQGQRLIQISASRQVPISDSGSQIFQLIKTGNGTFTTGAASANTGTGMVSPGTVTNPAAWNAAGNPKDFSVVFHVDSTVNPPATTYDIIDNVSGLSLTTGAAPTAGPYLRTYTDGAAIDLSRQLPPDTNPTNFDYGAQLTIQGQPATGDTFTVKASTNQDLFKTVYDMITAVQTAQRTSAGNAKLANDLNVALSNLDNSLDNVLRVRAAVGARQNEVDAIGSAQSDLTVEYKRQLSDLRDLDYAQAVSDLTRQQLSLEAAQKSFVRIQGLTLFNFL
jgi:flagellar hook-associated protein 3 FlgL